MGIPILKDNLALKIALSCAVLFAGYQANGQSLSRVVIGTAGGFTSNGDYSLSYTVGEVAAKTTSNENYFLTQGFQQSDDLVLYVPDEPNIDQPKLSFEVYPNPFRNKLLIRSDEVKGEQIDIYVIDMLGNIVEYNASVQSAELTGGYEIATESWTSGIYFVRVVIDDGQVQQDLKIVKNK